MENVEGIHNIISSEIFEYTADIISCYFARETAYEIFEKKFKGVMEVLKKTYVFINKLTK